MNRVAVEGRCWRAVRGHVLCRLRAVRGDGVVFRLCRA